MALNYRIINVGFGGSSEIDILIYPLGIHFACQLLENFKFTVDD